MSEEFCILVVFDANETPRCLKVLKGSAAECDLDNFGTNVEEWGIDFPKSLDLELNWVWQFSGTVQTTEDEADYSGEWTRIAKLYD